jgi:hypothetical protein
MLHTRIRTPDRAAAWRCACAGFPDEVFFHFILLSAFGKATAEIFLLSQLSSGVSGWVRVIIPCGLF